MKKNYLIAVLLAISFYSHSQENKNKFMLNGHVRYSGLNERTAYTPPIYHNNYSIDNSSLGIHLGYFVSTNFAIGISAAVGSYSSESATDTQAPYVHDHSYINLYNSCGIFTRYNRALPDSKFVFFLQLNTDYYRGHTANTSTFLDANGSVVTTKSYFKRIGINASLNPGIVYFINNKFSVESTLGAVYYRIDKSEEDNIFFNTFSGFGSNFSLRTINLAFSYYFGKKA